MADLTNVGLCPRMNQLMSLQMTLCDELFSTALMITHEWAISRLYYLNFKLIHLTCVLK